MEEPGGLAGATQRVTRFLDGGRDAPSKDAVAQLEAAQAAQAAQVAQVAKTPALDEAAAAAAAAALAAPVETAAQATGEAAHPKRKRRKKDKGLFAPGGVGAAAMSEAERCVARGLRIALGLADGGEVPTLEALSEPTRLEVVMRALHA